jgi:hypothetical protein
MAHLVIGAVAAAADEIDAVKHPAGQIGMGRDSGINDGDRDARAGRDLPSRAGAKHVDLPLVRHGSRRGGPGREERDSDRHPQRGQHTKEHPCAQAQ